MFWSHNQAHDLKMKIWKSFTNGNKFAFGFEVFDVERFGIARARYDVCDDRDGLLGLRSPQDKSRSSQKTMT